MPKYDLQFDITVRTPILRDDKEAFRLAKKFLLGEGVDVLIYYPGTKTIRRKIIEIKERKTHVCKKRERRV